MIFLHNILFTFSLQSFSHTTFYASVVTNLKHCERHNGPRITHGSVDFATDLAPKPTEAVSNESLGDLLAHIGNHKDNALR